MSLLPFLVIWWRARAHIRASCGYYIRTERQRWSEKFATPLISTERASIRNNWPKTTKKKRSSSSCHVKTTYRRLKPIDRHVFHSWEYPWCVLFKCVSLVDWIDVFFLVPHSLSLTFVPRCRDSFRDAFQTNKLLLLLSLSSVEWDFPNSFFWFDFVILTHLHLVVFSIKSNVKTKWFQSAKQAKWVIRTSLLKIHKSVGGKCRPNRVAQILGGKLMCWIFKTKK